MHTNFIHRCVVALFLGLVVPSVSADDPFFHSTDPLAPRDEWGVLHQTPNLNHTDFFPRHSHRIYYYFKSGRELLTDPAYVAALQVCLRNRGYYCGPIDGIMSEEVSDAIAQLPEESRPARDGQADRASAESLAFAVGLRRVGVLPRKDSNRVKASLTRFARFVWRSHVRPQVFLRGCLARIRTLTKRSRISGATVTLRGKRSGAKAKTVFRCAASGG